MSAFMDIIHNMDKYRILTEHRYNLVIPPPR
jgi:hypothetical protein